MQEISLTWSRKEYHQSRLSRAWEATVKNVGFIPSDGSHWTVLRRVVMCTNSCF